MINKHLRDYERELPLWDRLARWHWDRVAYDRGPVFWCLKRVWWIPGFRWLWQVRCRNVSWRMDRHNRRVVAKAPDLYDWSRNTRAVNAPKSGGDKQ